MPPRVILGTADQRKAQRVSFLDNTDWMCRRQEDQLRQGRPTALSEEQYNQLLDYREDLRQWPVSGDYNEPFPIPPGWMS
jgi:hypothetical protein